MLRTLSEDTKAAARAVVVAGDERQAKLWRTRLTITMGDEPVNAPVVVVERGRKGNLLGTLQAYKGVHDSNMTDLFYATRLPEFQQRLDAFDIFFDAYQNTVADAPALRARAHRALAEDAYWSGAAQITHGRFASGAALLRFAFKLRPRLRFLPPVGRTLSEGRLGKFFSRRFGGR